MNFIFVDDTGDTGSNKAAGSSAHFGMALLHVEDNCYSAVRQLLAQIRWLSGTFGELKLQPKPFLGNNVLRGLGELARQKLVFASGLFIVKDRYGGRYLHW